MTTRLNLTADQLDESSGEPLYQQIYRLIREHILSGHSPANTRLPAEQELTRSLGVSRITVKRALNELAMSGLVRRQRGQGTMVVFDAATPTVKGSFENLFENLRRMGLETQVQLLDVSFVVPDADILAALDLAEGTQVQRVVRLRRLEAEPFSHLVSHIPADVASGYAEEALASASLIQLLEDAGHGPRQAEQTITACPAESAIASVLGIATGAPLLRIDRIMRDANRRPVQALTAHYRSDRFQYQMHLTRNDDKAAWSTES